jgi:phosphoribosyl 1,2-cyclic phosphate phosphodiesterase
VADETFRVQFLGTGTSTGVPLIGCQCPTCQSTDAKDKRWRTSLYVTLGDAHLIIDTGPDFRAQCLQWQVPHVDAVFITHLHADHMFGFDDLRRYNTLQNDQVITCYCGPETREGMRRVFPYIDDRPNLPGGLFRPRIVFQSVTTAFEACNAKLTPLPVLHGSAETFGLRIDAFGKSVAYMPDVHEIPEETFAALEGLDVLILNLLRERPHPTHLTRDRAQQYAMRIGAKQTYFTHISHDIPHVQLEQRLGPRQALAYDGLTFYL